MTRSLRIPAELEAAFEDMDEGVVFYAKRVTNDWESVISELTVAFDMTRYALREKTPIAYVVHQADLLGQRGTGPAMVATALLSGARTAAIEGRKPGVPVNVLAIEGDESPEVISRWCRRLLETGGPTGELVRLGGDHLGKALP